ncbi:MAG: glycosyltransferase family 2 protein [Acidobacteria bacterium]|nr:MAG: glycosyltransferase family 2 protein [Acidobacteriota bacterium]
MSPPVPELSVVIPAYNEEKRLGASLERICAYLDGRGEPYEILVADDGSRDATPEVAARFAGVRVLRSDVNQGKGAALKRGVLASRGRRVLLTDADLSTPIEELAKLEAAGAGAEVILGSRAAAGARILKHQPLYRELMGKTFNKLIKLAGVRGIADTQCGFKLLAGDAARRLFARLHTAGFAYDVELVWLARRHGYKVVEVGVTWIDSPDSRVHPIRHSWAMLREILRFRRYHRRG